MIHAMKADVYRMRQERLSLVSGVLVLALVFLMAYLGRDDSSSSAAKALVGHVSSFLPLFFITPARIFFGDDYANRTINNSLVRRQQRGAVFAYKWLAFVTLSLVYVLGAVLFLGLFRQVLTGVMQYDALVLALFYQLPFYLVIIGLCGAIFNIFDKIYQSYLVYLVLALLFDQLGGSLLSLAIGDEVVRPYLMFQQLVGSASAEIWLTQSSVAALVFSVIYSLGSALLFSRREFK